MSALRPDRSVAFQSAGAEPGGHLADDRVEVNARRGCVFERAVIVNHADLGRRQLEDFAARHGAERQPAEPRGRRIDSRRDGVLMSEPDARGGGRSHDLGGDAGTVVHIRGLRQAVQHHTAALAEQRRQFRDAGSLTDQPQQERGIAIAEQGQVGGGQNRIRTDGQRLGMRAHHFPHGAARRKGAFDRGKRSESLGLRSSCALPGTPGPEPRRPATSGGRCPSPKPRNAPPGSASPPGAAPRDPRRRRHPGRRQSRRWWFGRRTSRPRRREIDRAPADPLRPAHRAAGPLRRSRRTVLPCPAG